jgi:hypothetical protein
LLLEEIPHPSQDVNVWNSFYKTAGIGACKHATLGNMVVFIYSNNFSMNEVAVARTRKWRGPNIPMFDRRRPIVEESEYPRVGDHGGDRPYVPEPDLSLTQGEFFDTWGQTFGPVVGPYEGRTDSTHTGLWPSPWNSSQDRSPNDNYSHNSGPNGRGYNYNNENDVANYGYDEDNVTPNSNIEYGGGHPYYSDPATNPIYNNNGFE